MNIIPQNNQNEIERVERILAFFKKFHLGSILKSAGAYRQKGVPVVSLFIYLVGLIFTHNSMYMDTRCSSTKSFSKDTVYRFLKDAKINWSNIVSDLSSNVIDATKGLTREERKKVIIIDDSTYERPTAKKVELLARVFDHTYHKYIKGFRLLTAIWSDGETSYPIAFRLLSTENKKNRYCEAGEYDKRTIAYKIRKEAQMKATDLVIKMLASVKTRRLGARYVLFDTWFCSPDSLIKIKKLGYDVIAMAKRNKNFKYCYDHQMLSLDEIYKKCRKRRGKSRYILSVTVQVTKGNEHTMAKVVYVRNRKNRKDYLCLISTDTSLSEEEIIATYGIRWNIEVFFKMCKSCLKLTGECRAISYDAMTAHVAVVFARYTFLAYEQRCENDQRTMGELLFYICEEVAEVSFEDALKLLLSCFEDLLIGEGFVGENEIKSLLEKYLSKLPSKYKSWLLDCA